MTSEPYERRRRRALARWKDALIDLIADHRRRHPEDDRSDRQLLGSVMHDLLEQGVVHKDPATGKWLVPELTT
jgi:hypothetical protein